MYKNRIAGIGSLALPYHFASRRFKCLPHPKTALPSKLSVPLLVCYWRLHRQLLLVVEVKGVEPLSAIGTTTLSTCLVECFGVGYVAHRQATLPKPLSSVLHHAAGCNSVPNTLLMPQPSQLAQWRDSLH